MRRTSLLAALLLPLPFTALPVVAVLLGGAGSVGERQLAINPAPIQQQAADAPVSIFPLAYGVSDTPVNTSCHTEQPTAIEG